MSLRNISSVLIGIIISNMFLSYNTNAWLVPWTINKATYTSSIQCKQENKKYSPTWGSCESYCASWHYEDIYEEQCTPNPDECNEVCFPSSIWTCTDTQMWTVTPWVERYECSWPFEEWEGGQICTEQCTPVADTCIDVDTGRNRYVCDVTSTRPVMTGEFNFTHYSDNSANPTYTAPSGNRKLWNDATETCNKWVKWDGHTKPLLTWITSCIDWSKAYYQWGANGSCYDSWSTDNLITTFDQEGNISRSTPSNSDNVCTIEWRYAQIDDTKPTIIVDSLGSIKTWSDQWCNLDKYASRWIFSGIPYGSWSNIKTSGCNHYDQTWGDDLVDEFSVTIQDNLSGLAEVKIELWTCWATYDFTWNLSDLINSTSSPSWVKSWYLSPITFSTETATTYAGKGIKSLKEAFWLTWANDKLHDCLAEGENYLKITVKDAARLDSDWVTWSPNENDYSSLTFDKAIRIDNSQPAFKINSADNPSSSWYDHSVEGTVTITDNESWWTMCTAYQVTWTWTCTWKPADSNWLSPVNSDGTYDIYSCDSMQITTPSVCMWKCSPGYILSADKTTCDEIMDTFTWDYWAWDTTCSPSLVKTQIVECHNSAWEKKEISNCDPAELTLDAWAYELSRTVNDILYAKPCTLPTSCFTLWTSQLGNANASLCSN